MKPKGITMYTKNVLIQNQVGLHARPATYFIQKANEFKSSIWIERAERRVNAKSLPETRAIPFVVALCANNAVTLYHSLLHRSKSPNGC